MDILLDNWEVLFTGLLAVIGVFKWVRAVPYVNFAKETGDIYIKYNEYSPDGFSDDEYKSLGKEFVEAVEAGKIAFKKEKK